MGSPSATRWITLSDPRAAEAAKWSHPQAPQGVPKQTADLCTVSYYLRSRKFLSTWGHNPHCGLTYQVMSTKHVAHTWPLKNYVQIPGKAGRKGGKGMYKRKDKNNGKTRTLGGGTGMWYNRSASAVEGNLPQCLRRVQTYLDHL